MLVCGDGDYDADALVGLAERAGWPVLAEPSSGARRGPNALTGYQYLLAAPEFMAARRPEVIVSAGRPGLTRPQSALLAPGGRRGTPAVRHVVIGSGPGMWADPQRAATDVAAAVRLDRGSSRPCRGWLDAWRRADAAATGAAGAVLDAGGRPGAGSLGAGSRPGAGRRAPGGAVLWCGNSLSVRDIDLLHAAAGGRPGDRQPGGERDRRHLLHGGGRGAGARG